MPRSSAEAVGVRHRRPALASERPWLRESQPAHHSPIRDVACCASRYAWQVVIWDVIQGFRHKGLRLFLETGNMAGIQLSLGRKLRLRLAALHSAARIEDLDLPGYRLHLLKGADKGRWSIWVNGNWRLTFLFRDGHVFDLNFEDYH